MFFQFANNAAEGLKELGFQTPAPEPREHRVPGDGKWVAPHPLTFGAIISGISRTYLYTFDEAIQHSLENARAMRRDPVIMDALRSRQLPVAQLAYHLEPLDEADSGQIETVRVLTEVIDGIPNKQLLLMALLEAVWWGRAGVQLRYEWDFSRGERRMCVADWRPINGDKIVFKFGGDVGLLVHGQFPGTWEPTSRGRAHFVTPYEREQLLIHQHEPEDPDFFEGAMAGAIHGVGVRGRLYWLWWMKAQVIAWLMDYLERVGAGGLTIYYYTSGDKESQADVLEAVNNQQRNNTILFPRPLGKDIGGGPGIQRIETGNGGAALLQSLVTEYFDGVIRRYILGQTLSSEAGGTGLGSGVADLHADTFGRIIKYDATNLQETLTRELVEVLCRYNCPGMPCPKLVFDVDQPDVEERLAAFQAAYQMGVALDEDEVRSTLGLSKPKPGASVIALAPPMSPTAVGQVPEGQPIMGAPGPETQTGGGQPPPA